MNEFRNEFPRGWDFHALGFRMSPTPSRSSQTMALPLTTSEWLDPLADLTNNGPTGLEPLS